MNKEDEATQRWLDEGSYGGGYPVSYQKSPKATDRIKREHAELVEALGKLVKRLEKCPLSVYDMLSPEIKEAYAILEKVK